MHDVGLQFGLIAEKVAAVNLDLAVCDKNGEIYTVRYDAVNAMLFNEFLKQRRKVEQHQRKIQQQDCKLQEQEATIAQLRKELQATVAHQQKQMKPLTAGLQKVTAQLEAGKAAPQIVDNNQ